MNPHPVAATMAAGGCSAALVTLIVWGLSMLGVAVPGEVAAALGTLIASGTHWLATRPPSVRATAPIAPTQPEPIPAAPAAP